jgi:hypothetical protein
MTMTTMGKWLFQFPPLRGTPGKIFLLYRLFMFLKKTWELGNGYHNGRYPKR